MALTLNLIPSAISEVMSGINEGLEQARDFVDSVRPPEKVVFSADAILAVNSLERIETRVSEPTVKTVTTTNVVETISINGNQEGLSPLPAVTTSTTTETISGGGVTKKSFEDQATEFVFEFPGPKSS
jgi:hypothetical protein